MTRPWLFALLAGCTAACASPGRETAATDPQRLQRVAREMAPFESAFQSAQSALDAGDDALARQILDRALARGPRGAALERARAYLRILEGRALVAALDLRLVAEPRRGGSEVRVSLIAAQSLERELVLRTGPGSLSLVLTGIDTFGGERRVANSRAIDAMSELVLAPGKARRIELGLFSVPDPAGMAVRARWALSLPAGHIDLGAESRPAQAVPIAPCEFERLANWLPTAPVMPLEFADYVRSDAFGGPGALELAVRIEGDRRAETLDLLAPVVARMSARVDLPRLAPSLRWLSGNRHLGNDGEGWKAWMRRWAEQRQLEGHDPGTPAEPSPERLALPAPER